MQTRPAKTRRLRLTNSRFLCTSKLIAFASFSSETGQLKFCLGIQYEDEDNFFTPKQRLFHVIYIFFSQM